MTRAMLKTKPALDPYAGHDIKSLMAMLSFRRPHESKTEEKFISTFIDVLGVETDELGNRWKLIKGEGESIMWSCHTDTVHYKGGMQAITKKRDIVTLNKRSKANCLGADDTAGVWLMVEMIKAGKPGLYVFHRGEEIGGLGSDFIATHTPEKLDGIQAAIALDRKGYDNVITHQGGRCCSDEFALSLAGALIGPGVAFKPDDTGLFTDTANYTHLIGECTNLSVGYFRQHSEKESLDVAFLCRLLDALLNLDYSRLVFEREAGYSDGYEDFDDEAEYNKDGYDYKWHEDPNHPDFMPRTKEAFPTRAGGLSFEDQEAEYMARYLRDHAEELALYLQDEGYTMDNLYQARESYRSLRRALDIDKGW